MASGEGRDVDRQVSRGEQGRKHVKPGESLNPLQRTKEQLTMIMLEDKMSFCCLD